MRLPALVVYFVFLGISSSTHAAPIHAGSPEMTRLFDELSVTYLTRNTFVDAFTLSPAYPGELLAYRENSPEALLAGLQIISDAEIPALPEVYVDSAGDVGYGLFAARDFHPGEILGFYTGEVGYQLLEVCRYFIPSHLMDRVTREGGAIEAPHLLHASWTTAARLDHDLDDGRFTRYALKILESHPFAKTTPISINAEKFGNETRFINHGDAEHANCRFEVHWMNYRDFMYRDARACRQLERFEAVNPRYRDLGADHLIPVALIRVTQAISQNHQFLSNYGDGYWTSRQIQPQRLSACPTHKEASTVAR